MKPFDIQLRDDCAYSALSRSFTAPVCVYCGGICFPDDAWTDFPVAMLCMWTDQLRTLLGPYGDGRRAMLYFLDGGHWMECTASGNDLQLAFFSGAVCRGRAVVRAADVLRAVKRAIRTVELLAEQHGYTELYEYDALQAHKQWIRAFLDEQKKPKCENA